MCNEREELEEVGSPPAQIGRDPLALAHAAYYGATGIWPLVSLRTFEVVTGPKLEGWLVKMVGLLAASIAIPIGVAGARGRVSRELALLGALSAISFGAVDVWYALRGRIKKTYLLDAPIQALLAAGWGARLVRAARGT